MKNKDELQVFDKKKIKYIQENYKVSVNKKNNFIERISNLRKETNQNIRLREYKKMLDLGKINEKDIPPEYVEDLKKIYKQQITELKMKIKKENMHK